MAACGTHTVLDLHGCNPSPLNDPAQLRDAALEAMRCSGAEPLGEHFRPLQTQGVGGIVLAPGAHLSLHTRPEAAFAAVDLFIGDSEVDVDAAAACLQQQLNPSSVVRASHHRGDDELGLEPAVEQLAQQVSWFTEYHYDGDIPTDLLLSYSYAIEQELAHRRSAFQDIKVIRNPVFGRALVIDNFMNVTEGDEFTYHEMLAHVPLLLQGDARRVLVIGGGDGGLIREVLRHPAVERVDLVEIDAQVIELSRAHLPTLGGAFDDPRVQVHITDGVKYVAGTEHRYDAVLIDSTDPVGPGKVLYSERFYRSCQSILRDGGVLAAQGLSPWLQQSEQDLMFTNLRAVFADVRPYLSTVPSYPGGQWVFALAADRNIAPERFDRELAARLSAGCRYYTPEIHGASFCLPAFIDRRLRPR